MKLSHIASRLFTLLLAVVLVGVFTFDAEARRLGGGKSMGRQSSNVTQRQATPPAAAPGNPSQSAATAGAAGAGTAAAGAAARPAAKAPRRPNDTNAITGDAHPVEKLMRQVRGALQQQQGEPPVEGVPTPRRGIRSEVGGSPSDNAHGAVPTNMPALAQRLNPRKAEPVNKKIHASARGRQKVETAKRDAR